MQLGDPLLLRSLKSDSFDKDGKWAQSITFKAKKGKAFLVLLLAEIDVSDSTQYSTEPPLNALGWYFCEDCQVKAGQIESVPSISPEDDKR